MTQLQSHLADALKKTVNMGAQRTTVAASAQDLNDNFIAPKAHHAEEKTPVAGGGGGPEGAKGEIGEATGLNEVAPIEGLTEAMDVLASAALPLSNEAQNQVCPSNRALPFRGRLRVGRIGGRMMNHRTHYPHCLFKCVLLIAGTGTPRKYKIY